MLFLQDRQGMSGGNSQVQGQPSHQVTTLIAEDFPPPYIWDKPTNCGNKIPYISDKQMTRDPVTPLFWWSSRPQSRSLLDDLLSLHGYGGTP